MNDIPRPGALAGDTGADVLVRALTAAGIDTCFGNPGTSEMSFLAALDRVGGMRCVLGLQENVVTGAADGFYRMAGRPAATLLHLGPGLTNGAANLHNARKARSGIVNVIGEHATGHLEVDSPLKADLDGLTRPVSDWQARVSKPGEIAALTTRAVARASARPPQVASLLLHGDAAWSPAGPQVPVQPEARPAPDRPDIAAAVEALRRAGDRGLLLLGGLALRTRPLELAARVGRATGCRVASCFGIPRIERGAGRHALHRLPYAVDLALAELARFDTIVTVQSPEPIGFFGYPGRPSLLRAPGSRLLALCGLEADPVECLAELAEALGGPAGPPQALDLPGPPQGALTPERIAAALAHALPEGAIVIDESLTTGRLTFPITAGARPHDWLQNLGGAIGFGTPAAVGAAIACPDRPVLCLAGDGSFMMTPQALWTQAREGLNVTNVVFANREYRILRGEVANVGAGPLGPRATDMLRIDAPAMDFAGLARSLGMPAVTVDDAESLTREVMVRMAESGPSLIQVDCA